MRVVIAQNDALFGGPFHGLGACTQSICDWGDEPVVLQFQRTQEIDRLYTLYRHRSTNSPVVEQFCFARWFMVRDYMHREHLPMVLHIDSDVLMFAGAEELREQLPASGWMYTHPAGSCLLTMAGAEYICETLLNKYPELDAHTSSSQDYVFLERIYDPAMVLPLDSPGKYPLTVDGNLYLTCGDQTPYKRIQFQQGKAYWIRDSGERIRMANLHCWGKAKQQMHKIRQQARVDTLSTLEL